jgi:hypothetical protein
MNDDPGEWRGRFHELERAHRRAGLVVRLDGVPEVVLQRR